jgi:hypothetical protein
MHAPIELPYLDGAKLRSLGENFLRSQPGCVVIEAIDHDRLRNVAFGVEKITSVTAVPWHRRPLLFVGIDRPRRRLGGLFGS